MQRLGVYFPDWMGLLICPRPVFVVANSHDIASLDSTEYALREAARFYEIMGCPDRIKMQVWDKGHAYETDQLAVAMGWFNRWLKDKPEDPVVTELEPENVFDIDELVVCRNESVYSEGYKTPSRIFWDFAEKELCAKKDMPGFMAFLKNAVRPAKSVAWQELDRFVPGTGTGSKICCAPEEGMLIPADVLIPDKVQGIMVLVDECGRRDDLDWQVKCLNDGFAVFRPDVRGWGEMAPPEDWADWEGWSRNFYDSRWRYLYSVALMTGRNLVLDRARDLAALVSVAREIVPGKKVAVWGRRQGALVALFAGLADSRIERLVLERYPGSFRDLMKTDVPLYRAEGNVHGLLRWGIDIQDLLAAYPGGLTSIEPLDSRMRPITDKYSGSRISDSE